MPIPSKPATPTPAPKAGPENRAVPAPTPSSKAATPKAPLKLPEQELKKAIGFPLKAAHDGWANLLHDDYFRLTPEELASVVDPAYMLVKQYGWEEQLLRYSAPVSLVVALGSIEIDRISYMMSAEGPEEAEDFIDAQPEIVTPNGHSPESVPMTSKATNVGERQPVYKREPQ